MPTAINSGSRSGDPQAFSKLIRAFAEKTKVKAELVVKQIGFDLYGRIIAATPVDTGRARSAWNIALNRADLSIPGIPASPPAGMNSDQSAQLTGVFTVFKFGDTIYITNNLPYAEPLENGHSHQAPAGMARTSLLATEANLRALVGAIK